MSFRPDIISNTPVKRNFFPEEVKPEHYIAGATSKLPNTELMPNGHGWKVFRPVGETQFKNGIDPQTCPAGGTLNAVEGIGLSQFKKLGFQSDLSERQLSILMGMSGNGGSPWQAAEMLYKFGAVPEAFLPYDSKINTIEKFFSPRLLPYSLFKIGLHWKSVYTFGFEWVFHPGMNLTLSQKQDRMKDGLKKSRLGVSGWAWSLGSNGKYYTNGPDIHFFNVDDYVDNEYWDAFDTYLPCEKKLDWNYNFDYCIRYSLTRKIGVENIAYDPKDAPEQKIEYIKYLIKTFIKIYIWEIVQ